MKKFVWLYLFPMLLVAVLATYLVAPAAVSFVVVPSGIGISAVDKLALDDSIVNIHTWTEQAVAGKINNCRERMIATWYPYLLNDTGIASIPRSKDDLITLIASRPWYKNRAARDTAP